MDIQDKDNSFIDTAIITDYNCVSIYNESLKIAKVLGDSGFDVEIYSYVDHNKVDKIDNAIFFFPFVSDYMKHIPRWNIKGKRIFYFVIEGYVYGMTAYRQYIKGVITTPSRFSADNLRSMQYTVNHVIPHQADRVFEIDHFYGRIWRSLYPSDKKIILYVGSNIVRKGLDRLKQAIDILRKRRKDFIVVLHSQNYRAPYHVDLSKIVGNGIVLEDEFGKIDKSRVYAKMVYSDFIVQPSLVEGFGLPVLEAMGLSKPLITINTFGVNEIANKDNSFMVMNTVEKKLYVSLWGFFRIKDYDPEDLADTIDHALDASKDVIEDKKAKELETVRRFHDTYSFFAKLL